MMESLIDDGQQALSEAPALKSQAAAPDAEAAAASPEPARRAPTFDVLPLSTELRETLNEIGYVHPTPVQIAVWEPATRGRDAMVQARTGTGKTAAFGMPIVDYVVRRSQPAVQVLVLCPTRELAVQVTAELERLGKRRNVRVTAVYGGAGMQKQIDAIEAGTHVVVGTPGRVLDHLKRGTLSAKGIRLLVLDECDEMLSMGFERELSAILEHLPSERQTLLFSATLPPDIERLSRTKLKNPEIITLSGDHVGALEIQHFVYMIASDKLGSLLRIIEVENPDGAIIFCNTKEETERVAGALSRKGFDAEYLNGDLPQAEREAVMSKTREGNLRFLVATDVAARGIDISHLSHVINYDFPQDNAAYVHRTGRTGRAGRTGTAISLITPHEIGALYFLRLEYKIRPIEKQIPSEGELKTRAEADLVNMLAEAFLPKGTHPDDLALARRLLTHDQGEAIIAGLVRDHLGARPTAAHDAAALRRSQKPAPTAPRQAARPEAPREGRSETRQGPARRRSEPSMRAVDTRKSAGRSAAPSAREAVKGQEIGLAEPLLEQPAALQAEAPKAPFPSDIQAAEQSVPEIPAPAAEPPPAEEAAVPSPAPAAVSAETAPAQTELTLQAAPAPASEPLPEPLPETAAPALYEAPPDTHREAAPEEEIQAFAEAPPPEPAPVLQSAPELPPAQPADSGESPAKGAPAMYARRAGGGGFGGGDAWQDGPPEGAYRSQDMRFRPHRATEPGRNEGRADYSGGRSRGRDQRGREMPGGMMDRGPGPYRQGRAAAMEPRGAPAGIPPQGRSPGSFVRHSDFVKWELPEEEGDDLPILGDSPQRPPRKPIYPGDRRDEASPAPYPFAGSSDDSFVEIYIGVGRREGIRASDLQRILMERAGLERGQVQRIRVRDRSAFISVPREELGRAIQALNGTFIAGKPIVAEPARERSTGSFPDRDPEGPDDD